MELRVIYVLKDVPMITFSCFSHKDWGENEKYRAVVEEGDSLKMMGVTCYTRVLKPDYFNFVMSPLCQKMQ